MTLDIESVAAGGDGVARRDGMVVFVPRTAPGDRIVARVTPGRRFARGAVDRVEAAGPGRVTPECPHYERDRCGGCQMQHVSLAAQHDAKRAIISDAMRRIGRRTMAAPELRAGASPWRYRHRLSLALRRTGSGWLAGLHAFDDPGIVFSLADCRITDARVLTLWREVLAAATLLPDAPALRGTVRLVGDRGAFALEGATTWTTADEFAQRLPSFDGVWWTPEGARRRRVGTAADGAPLASFSQVNPAVAAMMLDHIEARAIASKPAYVVDAYAGAGDLAVRLQGRGIRVTAIELDEDASAWSARQLKAPSRAVTARVEDVLPRHLPADLVVLNPPRGGVSEAVTRALESSDGTRRIIYVSCDPATLARDVARLPAWRITAATAFDMFPQTAHIETVLELSRGAA
jgi:23S rRNA (uracil1939-C5)-methyltransferase